MSAAAAGDGGAATKPAEEVEDEIDWELSESRTINLVFLAKDCTQPENEHLMHTLSKLETKESITGLPRQDPTYPVHSFTALNYADFGSVKKKKSLVLKEEGKKAAILTVAIMSEMDDIKVMNAVYNRAKKLGMRVLLALPANNDQWCGMVDPIGETLETKEEQTDSVCLINEEIESRIIGNRRCIINEWDLGCWVLRTIKSMFASVTFQELNQLYKKHGLMRVHWCFSGIPYTTQGFFDDCLGIGYYQLWDIKNCTLPGFVYAHFTSNDEIILTKRRDRGKVRLDWDLSFRFNEFKVIDLSTTPFTYTANADGKGAHCNIGDEIEFDVFDNGLGTPVRFAPNPEFDAALMEQSIIESMTGDTTMDHTLKCQIKGSIMAARFCTVRNRLQFKNPPPVLKCDAWIYCIKHLVLRNLKHDLSFLPYLLSVAKEKVEWNTGNRHWTFVFDEVPFAPLPQKAVFKHVINPVTLFKQCLFAAGIGVAKNGYNPLKYAIRKGDSKFVNAAIAYEKSLNSQSTLEDQMAENHARWTAQSKYFVQQYLMKNAGGKECLKVLAESLMDFIRDRGDFTAVDLMGIVWHSDNDTKEALLNRLMLAMKSTLDYNTLHSDKIGWIWTKEAVLKHPLWLCPQNEMDEAKMEEESEEQNEDIQYDSSEDSESEEELTILEAEEKDDDDNDDDISSIIDEKKKEHPILFDLVKDHCDAQASEKAGLAIGKAFLDLVNEEKESWKELCAYSPTLVPQLKLLRQDLVDGGRIPSMNLSDIRLITLQTNTLDFNAEKMFDAQTYLSGLLLQAHLVEPVFEKLMIEALNGYGKVKIGPVKDQRRVLPKSEEYASEGKPHCYWPYSACVIDLIRCSVTVKNLSELIRALKGFETFISLHSDQLSLIRCKNGFLKFNDTTSSKKVRSSSLLPKKYCDVKMNVACKDDSGKRAVIGEVQFLLDCILKSKKKGHELYEVSRSMPLYKGASHRYREEWSFKNQLLLTIDNPSRMCRLLTFFPFQLTMDNIMFEYIFKSDWNDDYLCECLATAIVEKSNVCNASLLSSSMLSAISRMSIAHPLGFGIAKLICLILNKADSRFDCSNTIQQLVTDHQGKHYLIRALMNLDSEVKRTVVIKGPMFKRMKNTNYDDLSCLQMISFFQGWNPKSSINLWYPSLLILHEQRHYEPGWIQAVQMAFEMDEIALFRAFTHYHLLFWKPKTPTILQLARASQETHPKLVKGLLDKGIVEVSDLE